MCFDVHGMHMKDTCLINHQIIRKKDAYASHIGHNIGSRHIPSVRFAFVTFYSRCAFARHPSFLFSSPTAAAAIVRVGRRGRRRWRGVLPQKLLEAGFVGRKARDAGPQGLEPLGGQITEAGKAARCLFGWLVG